MIDLLQLEQKYPFLEETVENTSFHHFGFECGEGWFDVIDSLCSKIYNHIIENNITNFHVLQVKEKFGGLRFYVRGSDSAITGFILDAERLSKITCEKCGNDGEVINDDGCLRASCEDHK
jgi:hypothetical protein